MMPFDPDSSDTASELTLTSVTQSVSWNISTASLAIAIYYFRALKTSRQFVVGCFI